MSVKSLDPVFQVNVEAGIRSQNNVMDDGRADPTVGKAREEVHQEHGNCKQRFYPEDWLRQKDRMGPRSGRTHQDTQRDATRIQDQDTDQDKVLE